MTTTYFAGLDLGLTQQFTALAVLEMTTEAEPNTPERKVTHYALRHLERFALGTPYSEVGKRVAALFTEPPLRNSSLGVDQTAVGKPVINLLRQSQIQALLRPLTVSAGHQAQRDDRGDWVVPKKELVSTLQVLLQGRRLKVATTLPEAQTLVQELQTFQMKVTLSETDTFEEWRERPHDDLVLAAAIAAWLGERMGVGTGYRTPQQQREYMAAARAGDKTKRIFTPLELQKMGYGYRGY